MTLDATLDELRDAASDRGCSYEVRENTFYLGEYEISLQETEDGVVWSIPAIVGGRFIQGMNGIFSKGDAAYLVDLIAPYDE